MFPEFKKTSIYDEDTPPTSTTSTTEHINQLDQLFDNQRTGCVYSVDLSGPKKSLLECIDKLVELLNDRPDDFSVTVYFVAGNELTPNDWSGLIDYISSLKNPIDVVYRGTVYPETLKVLTNFNNLALDKDCKFAYIGDKLNIVLKTLLNKPDSFRLFLEHWIERGHRSNIFEYTIDDLQKFGFKFEILGQ